jgi:branched-chain amino acid transport system substrate-binding protein
MSWTCNGVAGNDHASVVNEDGLSCSECGRTQEERQNRKNGDNSSANKKFPIIPVAIAALVIAGGGVGALSLLNKTPPIPTQSVTSPNVNAYISLGDRILFSDNSSPEKQEAVKAFAAKDFSTAVTKLEAVLKANRNDPEALIYLNNARLGDKEAFQIAAVVPISSSANPARELLRGVAQAQDEAIKLGISIKVAIADDNNDPKQAGDIANALVQNQDILAVVGHGTSKTSLVGASIYSQNQLLMIAPTSTTSGLTQVPKGADGVTYVYRTIVNDQFTGTALARHMLKDMNKRNAIVFYNSGSAYSKSLKSAFSTTLGLEGGTVVSEVDLSQNNQSPQLTGVDVLVLLPDSDTMPQAMAIAKANQNRLPLLGGDAVYRIENLQDAGKSLNGMVISTPWHPKSSSDPLFPETSEKLWGAKVNWRTALSYDTVQVLRSAISIGLITPKSGTQGRANLAKILAKSTFEANGATGKVQFLPSGDRNSRVILLQVMPGNSSGTGFDFVPIK